MVTAHLVRDRTGFDKELYLACDFEMGFFSLVRHRAEIKMQDFMESLHDGTIYRPFTLSGGYGVVDDFVFISGELLEFPCNDGFVDEFGKVGLVVYVLVVFLHPEYGGLARAEAGTEQPCTATCGERTETMLVVFLRNVPLLVLEIHP